MSWNHRVIKKTYKYDGEEASYGYEIHEVYYDKDGRIDGWTEQPVNPYGETVEELHTDLAYFLNALDKPVLEIKDKTLVEVK
jgi:hypothetical protein